MDNDEIVKKLVRVRMRVANLTFLRTGSITLSDDQVTTLGQVCTGFALSPEETAVVMGAEYPRLEAWRAALRLAPREEAA